MKIKIVFTSLLIVLLLAACGGGQTTPTEPTPDVAAVRTSAASTVVSQFTLTAAVFTPTFPASDATEPPVVEDTTATATQEPVAQETSASGTEIPCDILSYDPITVDVNVPDNTTMAPGQEFIKTWRVKNTGSCPWGAGYALAYAGYDDDMDGQFIALTEVIQPGQEAEISVQFKAPSQAGIYVSAWSMRNASGFFFEDRIFVKIVVQ